MHISSDWWCYGVVGPSELLHTAQTDVSSWVKPGWSLPQAGTTSGDSGAAPVLDGGMTGASRIRLESLRKGGFI